MKYNVNDDFFHIDFEHLEGKTVFPFNIFIFNPVNGEYTPFLFANGALTRDKIGLLHFIVDRAGEIAISKKQQKTFISSSKFKKKEIPGLCEPDIHELEKARQKRLEEVKKKQASGELKDIEFYFNDEFSKAVEEDHFSRMIERMRDEVTLFSLSKSHTISLASHLCDMLLKEDNYINRVVAVSYFLAKELGMTSEELLSDLTCAAFLHHIGFTQIDLMIIRTPILKLASDNKKQYLKHQRLAHHILRKSGVELSDTCINLILDHHERTDGKGSPAGKKEANINSAALILGAVSHMFEYATGKVTGDSKPIKIVINDIYNQSFAPGLEHEFGGTITESLACVIDRDDKAKSQAA